RSTTAPGPAIACRACGPSPTPSVPSASPRAIGSIPKGAYVPFGCRARICIGMRFGLAEVGVIAAAILERFRLELAPGYRLETRQMPTIGPKHGMTMVPRAATGGVGGPEFKPALAA